MGALAAFAAVVAVLAATTDGSARSVLRAVAGLLFVVMLVLVFQSSLRASHRKASEGGTAYRGWERWILLPLLALWVCGFFVLRAVADRPDEFLFVTVVGAFDALTFAMLLMMRISVEKSYRGSGRAT